MSGKLKAVEEAAPAAVSAEMIAAALERRKERLATPLEHYDDELGGVFRYRALTGLEVRECRRLATVDLGKPTQHVDSDRLEALVVNRATVEPKVTTAMWQQLGQLGPRVQVGLAEAVLGAAGLVGDPVAAAEKSSPESPS